MSTKQKILTGVIMGAFVAGVFAPAGALAKVKIKGNGKGSYNKVKVVKKNKNVVKQWNMTGAKTFIKTGTNTGGNEVEKNVSLGGDNSVKTGTAKTTTNVTVTGGTNKNVDSNSCGCEEDVNAVIKGNGTGSSNHIFLQSENSDVVMQGNSTFANTTVVSHTNTGGNEVEMNVGGANSITTGNATTTTTVTVTGGDNINK